MLNLTTFAKLMTNFHARAWWVKKDKFHTAVDLSKKGPKIRFISFFLKEKNPSLANLVTQQAPAKNIII